MTGWKAGVMTFLSSRLHLLAPIVVALVTSGAVAQAPVRKVEQSKLAKSAVMAMHKVAIQVNQNDKAVMDLALNNVRNISEFYKSKDETVAIEIVAYVVEGKVHHCLVVLVHLDGDLVHRHHCRFGEIGLLYLPDWCLGSGPRGHQRKNNRNQEIQSTAQSRHHFRSPPNHAAVLRFTNLALDCGLGMREHSVRLTLAC